MGIESLQKAALAAGFVMATPDDDPPGDELFTSTDEETAWQPATGRWLVPASVTAGRRSGARETMMSAAAWIRGHLPLMGGRAPA